MSYKRREGDRAVFATDAGQLVSVVVEAWPGSLVNLPYPAVAFFAVNIAQWQMIVSGQPGIWSQPHMTISLGAADLDAVRASMFQRLEAQPEVVYLGAISDLAACAP